MKKSKKSLLLLLLAVFLVATSVFGTIAWLTATDFKENTFVVGKVNKPATDPITGNEDPSLNGYISEPNFDPTNNELLPGGVYTKDPYVGIGAKSDESFVYVYIKSDFASGTYNHVNFTINTDAWEPVANRTTAGSEENSYIKGLFKYKTTLQPTNDSDAWTSKPLFNAINVAAVTTTTELDAAFNEESGRNGKITVYAYIHQAKDGNGESLEETAQSDAFAWADAIISGN